MDSIIILNKLLCDILFETDTKDVTILFNEIDKGNDISTKLDSKQIEIFKKQLSYFMTTFQAKLKKSIYQIERFKKTYKIWLDGDFTFKFKQKKYGRRPIEDFNDCSLPSKRRRILQLQQNHSADEIQKAFIYHLKLSGKKEKAQKILEVFKLSDADNETIDDSYENTVQPISADEALAVIEDAKLSKYQYEVVRQLLKKKGVNIFPSYKDLAESKRKCYPDNSDIEITDTGAKVNLQKLLDNNVERILAIPIGYMQK